jgi:hypothetical protein
MPTAAPTQRADRRIGRIQYSTMFGFLRSLSVPAGSCEYPCMSCRGDYLQVLLDEAIFKQPAGIVTERSATLGSDVQW